MSLGSFSHVDHVDPFHDDQSVCRDEQILGTSVSVGVDEHDTALFDNELSDETFAAFLAIL